MTFALSYRLVNLSHISHHISYVKGFAVHLMPVFSLPSARWKSCTRGLCTSSADKDAGLPVLTLYTKDPCPLCDDAVEELQPYRHRFTLEKVDITVPENKQWYKNYRFDIPVFHFNGSYLMKHRVNHKSLETELSKWEQENNKSL